MSCGQLRGAAALLAVLVVLAGLPGCSSIPIPFFGGKKADAPAAPACPAAVILRPLANTALFNAGGRELKPQNVAWYGVFSDISATCQIAGDTLRVSLDNIIVAERGPSVRGNDVDLNYFVALTAADQTILGKKSIPVHVTLPSSAKRGGVNDHVEVAFATGQRPLTDLNITVGFQQTPEAIEFYKNFRGR